MAREWTAEGDGVRVKLFPTVPGHFPYGRFIVPGSLHATFDRPDFGGVIVELIVEVIDGRPVVTDLALHRRPDDRTAPSIRGQQLRKIPVDRLAHEALLVASHYIEHQEGATITARRADERDSEALAAMQRQRPHLGRWKLTDEHLEEVARVYRQGEVLGRPVLEVAEHFGKPRPTASRWVAKARERGYLPAAPSTGNLEGCEEPGCSVVTADAHHVTEILDPLDGDEEGSGSSMTATYCPVHCPGGCEKEHQ